MHHILKTSLDSVVPGSTSITAILLQRKFRCQQTLKILILVIVLIFILGVLNVLTKEEETDESSEEEKRRK